MTDNLDQSALVCAAAKCTRYAATGSMLCAADIDRLGQWLAQLGTEYELLSAAPSMQGRELGTVGGTRLASQRSPGSTHVMAMRDPRRGTGRIAYEDADPWGVDDTPSVLATLASYADRVREGRDLAEPVTYAPACLFPCMHRSCLLGHARPLRTPLTVARERRLLATHLPWILGQDWAGEFHDEIRRLWALLRAANGHPTPSARARRMNSPCQACGVRAVTHKPGDDLTECQNCHARAPYVGDDEAVA